jgi:acyl-coenzyme A synthetase/AMP-(fatty) acid ligase
MPDQPPATLLAAWRRTLAEAPDATALIAADGRTWTRAELDQLAANWSATLPASVTGQRVAFALPNGPEWLATFIGLLLRQAIIVPLDASEPAEAQRTLARSVGARFLLINQQLETLNTPSGKSTLARTRRAPTVLVKLTSGSTGLPRGLPFTDAHLLADGRQVCAGMGIGPSDRNLAVIPFGHSYGLGNLVLPLLLQGTALACVGVPLPHAIAADIARTRPTIFPAVPALLRALAQTDLPAEAFACLRTVISAGAPLAAETAQAFHQKFNLVPHGFYGSSETGGISYDRTGEATLAGRSVGTPLPGVSLKAARGRRIRVLSAAVFRASGFSPADHAQLDATGELCLHGRAGRLVKIAGRRLDLSALETTLRSLPGVTDAFVRLHPDQPENLAAVLATTLTAGDLRPLLRERLASWKIPRRLLTLSAFPLTVRGKTDTRALAALLASP